ncbi:Ger(x)C family spore germination protein [Cohnella fermenti]|uniref:Ger(X)C family spore germination protein n=1 Tax=Cohnella fermenti TaxID=2565925 RepID=A0A4S4C746_9BACL|nr:Ger(x)C family spore germination C-terminal domain-containing protein [Cohnella fermenti]THF83759.1 Ger(x)C family spore germination protein [Cohnella fermenti]
MKRIVLALIACVLASGCGMKDIDKRFYVVTTGIDMTDNPEKPYRISLRLAITAARVESGSSRTEIQTVDAPSIAEGVRLLKSHVDKELEFGHCRMFILGKSLLEKATPETMSWFSRRRDIQMISYFGVGEPDALAVLKVEPKSERYPGNALFLSFGNEGTESPYTITTFLFDLVRKIKERGIDPILPIIRAHNRTYVIDKSVVANKQGQRLFLSAEETQLFKMTSADSSKSELVLPMEDGTRVVMYVSQIRTKVRISAGDAPTVRLKIKVSGVLEESAPELLEKDWHGLEQRMGQRFSKQVEELLVKLRDADADPYGFGLRYLAQHFGKDKEFKAWEASYPEAKFQVSTDVRITGPGVIR